MGSYVKHVKLCYVSKLEVCRLDNQVGRLCELGS